MHPFLSPLILGLLLTALLCLCWRRLGRSWRIVGLMLVAVALLLCTPLGSNTLVRAVESRLPSRTQCRDDAAMPIVLLSAGFESDPSGADDYIALAPGSWRRLRAAVVLWRRSARSELIIVGGGPYPVKESEVLARLSQDWGVPASALRVERRSTTTWESAFALRGKLPRRIRLVSSAIHLPRAVSAFEAAGFAPCAHASDSYYVGPNGWGYFVPQTSAMVKTEAALHEAAGTIVYALRAHRAAAAR